MTEEQFETQLVDEWAALVTDRRQPPVAHIATASAPDRASRIALVAELEDLRRETREMGQLIDSNDAAGVLATSRWSVVDVLAHLASWARQTRIEFETLLGGGHFDYAIHFEREGGPRSWNQREVDARAGRGLSDVVEEIETETERLTAAILDAPEGAFATVVELPRTSGDPPEPWRMPISAVVAMSCWHARLHLTALQRIMQGGP